MLDQRAEVLKFQVARDEPHTEIGNGLTLSLVFRYSQPGYEGSLMLDLMLCFLKQWTCIYNRKQWDGKCTCTAGGGGGGAEKKGMKVYS